MMTSFVMLGGIALFVGTITLLDWLGRRQRLRREAQERDKASEAPAASAIRH